MNWENYKTLKVSNISFSNFFLVVLGKFLGVFQQFFGNHPSFLSNYHLLLEEKSFKEEKNVPKKLCPTGSSLNSVV